ncbi:MAG: gliding motility lipoprotein GldH [Chitinophagales bacterium]
MRQGATAISRFRVLSSMLVVALILGSCDRQRVYETNFPVEGESWPYTDAKSFTFDISDTTARYNIFINVRHSFEFEWRNMYVQVSTQFPDGKHIQKRVNLPLSEADGHWYGHCMGDNCDMPVLIQQAAKFPMKGKYTFTLQQDMRVNPLPRIKAIGLRVERAAIQTNQP